MTSQREISPAPVASFLGDEHIDEHTYRRIMTDGYLPTTAYMQAGAEALNISIDPVTEERWRRMAAATYYIDDFIDTAPDRKEAHALYQAGLNGILDGSIDTTKTTGFSADLSELLVPSIALLYNSVADMEPSKLEALRAAALTINDIALEKSHTEKIQPYAGLLHRETDATVALLSLSTHPETLGQPTYERFQKVTHHAMKVAVFLDNAIDLREDYKQGITKVPASAHNMGYLAVQAIQPARELMRLNGSFRASWAMAREVRPYVERT